MFKLILGKDFFFKCEDSPRSLLIEMYHAGTLPSVKEYILSEIDKEQSHLRILVCTVAFGMGIDSNGIHRVIHFGPPQNLEAHVQETGRGGRNNKPSTCFLLYNGFLGSRCSDDMKRLINDEECCKNVIRNYFSSPAVKGTSCSCCDLCSNRCLCNKEECKCLNEPFGRAVENREKHL